MNKKSLVSVICICYNHDKFVVQALNSIINQNYQPLEIIVIDDCSTDNSVNTIKPWLEEHTDVQFLFNSENLGVTKSFNRAKALSKGEFIVDLAADDVLNDNAIEQLLEVFKKYPHIAIAYGNAELIDENGNFIEYYYKPQDTVKSGDIYEDIIGQTLKINSVASMIKSEVLEKLGGYDENLLYEDLDIWIRTARNYNFQYIDEVLVKKRILNTSLGNQFLKPRDRFSKKLNRSIYKILLKTYYLNRNIAENKALFKRLRKETKKSIKNYDFSLALKYLLLEFKLKLHLNLR